jgi:hypothetical protein
VLHYLERGASEGRDPSPLFDTRWYRTILMSSPSARTPLVHYLLHGGKKAAGSMTRRSHRIDTARANVGIAVKIPSAIEKAEDAISSI